MANVLFTRTSDPSSKPITDGQLIFDTSGNGKMYLDVGDKRLEMGGAINIDSTLDPTSENPIQNKAVAGVMLSTLAEIDKVTSKGKLTDALATKELNTKVTDLNTKVTDLETDVNSLTVDYVSKGKILKSLEEVTTATNAGFVPDALAIKELDTDLQGQINTVKSKLVKRKFVTKTISNQTYAVITNSELNIGTAFILDVNIERSPNYGYHFVTGHSFDSSSNLFVYFDGKINATVPIMIHYSTI